MTLSPAPTRVDRRKARTRKQLHDALIALILERGYDNVTIQDITDRADLSRATFYLHFRDKEELMLSGLHDVFDEIARSMRDLTPDNFTFQGNAPSLLIFRHAGEHRDIYRVMLKARTAGVFADDIKGYLARRFREKLEPALQKAALPVPIEVLCEHMASSLLGLIIWWIETDAPYTPEDMARMYHALNPSVVKAAPQS